MKSRSIVGPAGTAYVVAAPGDAVAVVCAGAGAFAVVAGELAAGADELRGGAPLGAPLTFGAAAAGAAVIGTERTFCEAASRALAQLARLGASSFGVGVSDLVGVAVEGGLV